MYIPIPYTLSYPVPTVALAITNVYISPSRLGVNTLVIYYIVLTQLLEAIRL